VICRICLCLALLLLAPMTAAADAYLPCIQTCAIARAQVPITWGQVTHVCDGDTIDVHIDGCPLEYVRVRLLGVDPPERGACYWAEAHDRTRQLEGQRVGLERDSSEWDSFGGLLRHVYSISGRWHNGDLVSEGYACVCTMAPDGSYSERLQERESAAMQGMSAAGARVDGRQETRGLPKVGRLTVDICWGVAPAYAW